jgi:ABC-2 type transport system ATP-binding protein
MTEGIDPRAEIMERPAETAERPADIVGRPAIVEARGLVKRYNGTIAVAGVDLSIPEGEIFGLVGPNGAGKTTMLRMLATLLAPTSGDAEVAGESVRRNPQAVRRVLGYMPDAFGVYDDMKVWEYLDFFGRCYGLGPAQRKRMIGDLLELVDLAGKRDAYVQSLSRGMQQRLCLAHALVHDPKVLLLDEPASGLDPRARVELREILRELRSMGKTILISSHILPELGEMCTGVAIIDHGRVLRSGSIGDIERSLRASALLRIDVLGDEAAVAAAREWLATDPRIADVLGGATNGDGAVRIEAAFDGTPDAQADFLRAMVDAGHRVVGFSQVTSDLEEIFLKVTGQTNEEAAA